MFCFRCGSVRVAICEDGTNAFTHTGYKAVTKQNVKRQTRLVRASLGDFASRCLKQPVVTLILVCSDFLFKLVLIGDSSVGKSCLLLRFAVGLCLL